MTIYLGIFAEALDGALFYRDPTPAQKMEFDSLKLDDEADVFAEGSRPNLVGFFREVMTDCSDTEEEIAAAVLQFEQQLDEWPNFPGKTLMLYISRGDFSFSFR